MSRRLRTALWPHSADLRRSDSPSDVRVSLSRGHIAASMLLLRRGAGVVTGAAAGPQLSQLLHRRWLNVHEYQGAQLLRDAGVRVPPGVACHTPEEVAAAARQLGGPDGEVVLKSQVLAGGRGLGTFTNGLKGGVHIVKVCVQYTTPPVSERKAPRREVCGSPCGSP